MKTGTATCVARVSGILLDPIEVSFGHPCIETYSLQTQGEHRILVNYKLKNVESQEHLEQLVGETIRNILDKIAFELEIAMGEPYLESAAIDLDENGNKHLLLNETIHISCDMDAVIELGSKRRKDLRAFLEAQTASVDIQMSQFRFAISQANPVSRFMFLYNILLALHGDKQANVDAYVLTEEPGTSQSSSPMGKGTETIYTRLRNEVAHVRKGAVPEKTFNEIKANVSTFQSLVKKGVR